jgi:hypothetical protein
MCLGGAFIRNHQSQIHYLKCVKPFVCWQALHAVNIKMEIESKHPLVLLAEDVKEIVIKDESLFAPILSRWNHQALAISASLVHDMYQTELVTLQTLLRICYFERFSRLM